MRSFGQTHIAVLLLTVAFYAVTMYAAYKLPRKGQTALFILGALGCACGLFWRYGLNMTLDLMSITPTATPSKKPPLRQRNASKRP